MSKLCSDIMFHMLPLFSLRPSTHSTVENSLRQYGREIWRKLHGDLDRPWRGILAKPINALRQRQHNEY